MFFCIVFSTVLRDNQRQSEFTQCRLLLMLCILLLLLCYSDEHHSLGCHHIFVILLLFVANSEDLKNSASIIGFNEGLQL